jgi:hypothetical protein
VGSGGQGNNEAAAPAKSQAANALKSAGPPAVSLLSSTQRVQAQSGGAVAESEGAYSHSLLPNVFAVPTRAAVGWTNPSCRGLTTHAGLALVAVGIQI